MILAPGPLELGLNQDSYELVIQDLEQLGHRATIIPPAEYRSGSTLQVLEPLAVYLLEFTEDHVIDAIILALAARLVANYKPQKPRTATIYGPDKKPLRSIELPTGEIEDDDDTSP